MRTIQVVLSLLLGASAGMAQFDLKGIVDLHVHCNPDSMPPRRIDAFEVAQLFQKEGLRAFVLKSQYLPTSQLAYAVNRAVPGAGAYGAIVLNRSMGMNPEAVEQFAKVTGGYARIVWMPTADAENTVSHSPEKRPFVAVSKNRALLPEVIGVLKVIKKYNLTLATGHLTPQEDLTLVAAARKLGVDRIIVTHAMPPPVNMSVEQMKAAAGLGAIIEFVYNLIYPDAEFARKSGGRKRLGFDDYAHAIHAIGAEHCTLSSDVGQPMRPVHTEAWKEYLTGLMEAGVTAPEIDRMAKRNPARLIGLE